MSLTYASYLKPIINTNQRLKIVQTSTFRYEIMVENSLIKNTKVLLGTAYWLIKHEYQ